MTAEERLLEAGYDGVIVFTGFTYDNALIGVSSDNRAIYDYDLMVEWLCCEEDFTYDEAVEWIEYNTIRALPYFGNEAPIVVYRLPEF